MCFASLTDGRRWTEKNLIWIQMDESFFQRKFKKTNKCCFNLFSRGVWAIREMLRALVLNVVHVAPEDKPRFKPFFYDVHILKEMYQKIYKFPYLGYWSILTNAQCIALCSFFPGSYLLNSEQIKNKN